MAYSLRQRLVAGAVGVFSSLVLPAGVRRVRHRRLWHLSGPFDDVLLSGRQFILAGWHQDVFTLFMYLASHTLCARPHRRMAMLSSRSFDGEITERTLRPLGFDFVRGSWGKPGAQAALRGMLRALGQGRSVVVIADGPTPPPYLMRPGAIHLARTTGVPLYVVRGWMRPQQIVASTWFRLMLPIPPGHAAVFSEGPIDVSGELEEARLRAESAMRRLAVEVDAHLYLRPRVTGGIRLADRDV